MSVTVAVLAGGSGSRIGGGKAAVHLGGKPLIAYPLAAARAAGFPAVVIAKHLTHLPSLSEPVIFEHTAVYHPLHGIVTAIRELGSVIAVPCDMPFVTPSLLERLTRVPGRIVIPDRGQPFPGVYTEAVLPELEAALEREESLRSVLTELHAHELGDVDPELLFSVNTLEDLATAEFRIRSGH
jgi:molybdopterin-guanine dinucleotide biosynthesis protein A